MLKDSWVYLGAAFFVPSLPGLLPCQNSGKSKEKMYGEKNISWEMVATEAQPLLSQFYHVPMAGDISLRASVQLSPSQSLLFCHWEKGTLPGRSRGAGSSRAVSRDTALSSGALLGQHRHCQSHRRILRQKVNTYTMFQWAS